MNCQGDKGGQISTIDYMEAMVGILKILLILSNPSLEEPKPKILKKGFIRQDLQD
jgi:hypothetical protein